MIWKTPKVFLFQITTSILYALQLFTARTHCFLLSKIVKLISYTLTSFNHALKNYTAVFVLMCVDNLLV